MIPEDWQVTTVGKVVSITTGNKNTQDKVVDGLYPFFVRSQQVERINTYSFDGEGVLTAGDGVGTGKIFHHIDGKFDFHQRVYLMYNFGDELDGYYFYIYFSNNFYDRIMSMTAKSSVDSVRREMIADMLMVMPPKAEQTAIANALSDVDALISELEKLIAKKQAIKTATMQQLLTGRTRLPQFALRADGTPKGTKPSELGEMPEDWEVVNIGDLGQVDPENLGSTTSPDYEFNYVSLEQIEKGVLVGTTRVIFRNAPSRARRVLKKGDILVSTVRPNLMSHYFVQHEVNDLICSTGFSVIRFFEEKLCPGYLYQHLFSSVINNQIEMLISGSNYPAINSGDVKQLKVQIGSVEEQTAIASILSDMDAEIQVLEQRLGKTRQIKQGMMQELLTGKTRLLQPLNKESQHG